MYKNSLAVMYVQYIVTPDDGYLTRNMYGKQYNVDTLHLSVYTFIPHIMVAVMQ
jgi:hypothetical protein